MIGQTFFKKIFFIDAILNFLLKFGGILIRMDLKDTITLNTLQSCSELVHIVSIYE